MSCDGTRPNDRAELNRIRIFEDSRTYMLVGETKGFKDLWGYSFMKNDGFNMDTLAALREMLGRLDQDGKIGTLFDAIKDFEARRDTPSEHFEKKLDNL